MSTENQLAVVPPKETALQVFQVANGLDPYLQQIRAEIDSFVPDVTTKKGRDAIASIAHKVARSKTALDNVGKELVAELKEIPKKVDAERKRMRDTLDAWKDEVRAPLNEWEAAEAARVEFHNSMIRHIEDCGLGLIGGQPQPFALLFRELEEKIIVDEKFEEFEAEAHRVKAAALAKLKVSFDEHQKREAEQAELERLRAEAAQREQKEREERIAREAADRARLEADQRAQAERNAAAKREADAKAASEQRELQLKLEAEQSARRELEAQQRAEQAERDAEAKAQAAAAAERQRQADEQARIEREAKAREADIAHKGAINRAALEAFIAGGMPEACAKQAVTLIAKRQIPNVQINY